MHEMSLATNLIEQIIDICKENNVNKVLEVNLECGRLKLVVPEVMQEAYSAVIVGTLAEESELIMIEIEPKVKCNKCSKEFIPEVNDFLCPNCNVADVEILQGDEIIIKSLVTE